MSKYKKLTLLIGDVFILYAALVVTLIIRYGGDFSFNLNVHLRSFSVVFPLWILVLYLFDLYAYKTLRNKKIIFQNLILAVLIAGAASVTAFYLFTEFFRLTPKTNLAVFAVAFLFFGYLFRVGALKIFTAGAFKIAVIGESPLITRMANYLSETPHAGYRAVSLIKTRNDAAFSRLPEEVKEKKIDLVVIENKLARNFSVLKTVYNLLRLEVGIIYFWNFYEELFEKAPLEELEESWFVENISTRRGFYDAAKRAIDLVLGLILGLVLLPLAVLITVLILITSGKPAVCKQKRIGKNNVPFALYKFRTMKSCDGGPLWTEDGDKRVTKLGRILRATHLDEIPQLINIVKGDISFTGPRPERIELVEKYKKFPYYEIRHIVKPGLTGWAQINYRSSASLEEAFEKLCYDIYYVKNRSFMLDLLIILKTIRHVFSK